MTPVDAISTCSLEQPTSAAAAAAIACAAAAPAVPVQALAQPLLMTIARARPPDFVQMISRHDDRRRDGEIGREHAAAATGSPAAMSARSSGAGPP